MKLTQENEGFSPISLVLETSEDVITFWDMITLVKQGTDRDRQYQMAVKISDWLSNEARI